MKVSAQSPRIKVIINSVSGHRYEATNKEVGGEIVSLQCSSSISNPAGGFSASFVAREVSMLDQNTGYHTVASIYNILEPRTLVDIYLNGYEVFLGLIETVSTSRQPNYRSIDVQGVSLGAVFQQFGTIFHRSGQAPAFAIHQVPGEDIQMRGVDQICPSIAIQDRFNDWMHLLYKQGQFGSKLPPMVFANGVDLRDMLIVRQSHLGGALSNLAYGSQLYWKQERYNWDGNFWNFFDSCVTGTLNEMWCDCGDRSVKLYDNKTAGQGFWPGSGSWNYYAYRDSGFQFQKAGNPTGLTDGSHKVWLTTGRMYLVMRPAPFDDEWVGITGIGSRSGTVGNPAESQSSFITVQDCLRDSVATGATCASASVITITDDNVYSTSLTKSGVNVSTSWQIMSALSSVEDASGDIGSPPEYDEVLTALYGHRPMILHLKGTDAEQRKLDPETGGVTSNYIMGLVRKLRDWNKWMDKYLSGTLLTYLNPFMRIGKWLVYQPTAGSPSMDYHRYYYITTVSHQYSFENPASNGTTVTLERGTPIREQGQTGAVFTRDILTPPTVREMPSTVPASLLSDTDFDARVKALQEQTKIEQEATQII